MLNQWGQQVIAQKPIKARLLQVTSSLRETMQCASKAAIQPQTIRHIEQTLVACIPDIQQYINQLAHQAQQQKPVHLYGIIEFDVQKRPLRQKIVMYVWQILNFICVNQGQFSHLLLGLLFPLMRIQLKLQPLQASNSLKHGLIFYHNLLVRLAKQPEQLQKVQSQLIALFGQILAQHFSEQSQHFSEQSQLTALFPHRKEEATILAEMEWLGFIFMQFFNNDWYSARSESFIGKAVERCGNGRTAYHVLHMIGNYFQEMVDKRITTELVSGFQCTIHDVKQMYSASQNCLIQLKISRAQLQYILTLFKRYVMQYKEVVSQYLKLKILRKGEQQLADINERWMRNAEVLTQILHILNNVLFIGGYNSKLQDLVIHLLLEQDDSLLSYFELSYLLYRNLEATRHKSKVGLLVEMELQAKKKLVSAAALELSLAELAQIELKGLVLEQVLAPGQLVSLCRLLSNLVHISQRAQAAFEKDAKYLHMVLSLTHDSVSQATMKEWAIMFIRNVSEWSPILRQEIAKVSLQMKVSDPV